MAPHFTYATVTQTLNAIASRLYDPTFQQWTQPELVLILNEALRTWNALSGFWRAEFSFNLTTDTWWYDLRTVSNTLIPYTVRQNDLIEMVENHLLEPVNFSGAWLGSAQFSLPIIQEALRRRQDETLGESACTIVRVTTGAALVPRTVLPDTTIDIRRVAWLPVTGPAGAGFSNKVLRQSDMFAARAFSPGYTTTTGKPPARWMQNAEPVPSFDVDIVPPVNGNYDLLLVQSGPAWVSGTNSLLNIPDDWSWVFKWGALMDLLSRESNAADPYRAEYCKRRFNEGKALLRNMPTVLAARINNVPVAVGTVRGADDYRATWQAAAAGSPKSLYSFGNLLAAAPKPNSSVGYSATISVCQNAPIDVTYVQVARNDYDTIIDLAQHIAMWKQGGEEFFKTIALYQRAQRQAALYNSKLKEMGFFEMDQLDTSSEQERRDPRFLRGVEPTAAN